MVRHHNEWMTSPCGWNGSSLLIYLTKAQNSGFWSSKNSYIYTEWTFNFLLLALVHFHPVLVLFGSPVFDTLSLTSSEVQVIVFVLRPPPPHIKIKYSSLFGFSLSLCKKFTIVLPCKGSRSPYFLGSNHYTALHFNIVLGNRAL